LFVEITLKTHQGAALLFFGTVQRSQHAFLSFVKPCHPHFLHIHAATQMALVGYFNTMDEAMRARDCAAMVVPSAMLNHAASCYTLGQVFSVVRVNSAAHFIEVI